MSNQNTKPLTKFTLFPSLPGEIRQQIWLYDLPGPQVMLMRRNLSPTPKPRSCYSLRSILRPQKPKYWSKYAVHPASYAGHLPIILSVNRESRAEALLFLTPLFYAYWNLEIDKVYFESSPRHNKGENALTATLLSEMREAGELDMFKHIAIELDLLTVEEPDIIHLQIEHP